VALESKLSRTRALLMLAIASSGALHVRAQITPQKANLDSSAMTRQSKFYCNLKALSPSERDRHKKLTEKLIAARSKVIETERGYEFRFSPTTISLAELAEWVGNESKCCPFFDFHIDMEREGSLLGLRLTGDEGIKAFIRAEFELSSK